MLQVSTGALFLSYIVFVFGIKITVGLAELTTKLSIVVELPLYFPFQS